MMEKINTLKRDLNNALEAKEPTSREVLRISEELDLLILQYYQEHGKKNGSKNI